jgi:hypothetical protein
LGAFTKPSCAEKSGWTSLTLHEKADLHLLLAFLKPAHEGIPMNNLTFWKPCLLFQSNASEFGMGSYSFEIPVDCPLCTSLNFLEFLECAITLWVDSIDNNIGPESCLLCQTDSTTAAGWLQKSNFVDKADEVAQLTTARHLAHLLIDTKSCLYSEWFPGEFNTVSDSLSRDFHLPIDQLSHLLSTYVPEQAPSGLTIQPLLIGIISWLTSLLRNQLHGEQWLKELLPSKFALKKDTRNISSQLESDQTTSLKTFPEVPSTK